MREGLARGVLAVRAARGIAAGDAECAQILDERDVGQWKHWLVRAATCADAHELWAMTDLV